MQYGVFDVFRDFQSFFQLENLGSHLAVCPDDRFLPQVKQILPEICQVRTMHNAKKTSMWNHKWRGKLHIMIPDNSSNQPHMHTYELPFKKIWIFQLNKVNSGLRLWRLQIIMIGTC